MSGSLVEKLRAGAPGICVYGIAPPKRATVPDQLAAIVAQQLARLESLELDGLVVYDIQDEAERITAPRPFPFLPTLDPETYAHRELEPLPAEKIVYRCVNRDTEESFVAWLEQPTLPSASRIAVLVGAPSRNAELGLGLTRAYALAREHAPRLLLGGIAIAERHAQGGSEHERMLTKTERGCRFFVTQAVYDVTSSKSLLSDYALAVRDRGERPVPIVLTFAPCGSLRTLSFMKWLGIAFPRWLENDLRFSANPLEKSLALSERIFDELWEYALEKQIPLGVNVESVSIKKAEIDASVELFQRLRARIRNRTESG